MSGSDASIAKALVNVLGNTSWEAVALSYGYLRLLDGGSLDEAAQLSYDRGYVSKRGAKERLQKIEREGLESQFQRRERTGSAENPITKLFPAFITEQRFVENLEQLKDRRKNLQFKDERNSGNLLDFAIMEGNLSLPINVKVASTKFKNAMQLVHLRPEDCVPIPAYKAYGALTQEPNLLYAICMDFELVGKLNAKLEGWMDKDEKVTWDTLNKFVGAKVRKAEDEFVYGRVKKYWVEMRKLSEKVDFHIISARKAIRILQKKPERTPGIGLKAWGTGANGEVNVHVSLEEDTKGWDEVADRIVEKGVKDILSAVNRKRTEVVYDPEI